MEKKKYEDHLNSRKKEITDQVMKKLIVRRKKLGLTQQDIAERTGMQRPNISRVESGRLTPSLEVLIKLAGSMGLELQIDFKDCVDKPDNLFGVKKTEEEYDEFRKINRNKKL